LEYILSVVTKPKGYIVIPSSERKGKTHKVIAPDGTVSYFGDANLRQHPEDPKRAKAFFARHRHNIDNNPAFKAFAIETWGDNKQIGKNKTMAKANDYIKLKAEKSKYCKGKTTKTAVKKAAAKYVKSTVAAGNKTKSEAEKAAKKVLSASCALKSASIGRKKGKVHVKEHDKAYPVKTRDKAGLSKALREKGLRLKHGYETTKIVRTIAGLKDELKKHGYVELVKVKHIAKK